MAPSSFVSAILRDYVYSKCHKMYMLNMNELVSGDDAELVEKDPNFIFYNFKDFSFYGVDETVYMIEGNMVSRYFGMDTEIGRRIYTFKVSPEMSSAMSRYPVHLESSMLGNPFYMLGPKVEPSAIRRPSLGGILIFSKDIAYADEIYITCDTDVDFELYVPERGVSYKLPQLRVRRSYSLLGTGYNYQLLHPGGKRSWLTETVVVAQRYPKDTRQSFMIEAYSFIDEYTFVVETDIGVSFCLGLHEEKEDMEWVVFRGPKFTDKFDNFVIGNELLLSTSGACKFSTSKDAAADDDAAGRVNNNIVPLPITSRVSHEPYGSRSRHVAIGLLDSNLLPEEYVVAGILQLRFKHLRVMWSLDVVGLDVSNFNHRRFARLIKSFKGLICTRSDTLSVECVFGVL